MSFNRRQWLHTTGAASAASLLAGIGLRAHAQAQVETLMIITGFAAGGTSDAICRRVATKLSGYAKTALVENRTGAGGQIAINYVKGRAPDGGTMLQTPTSMLTIYPHIYKKLAYDPLVDLAPVSVGCIFEFCLAVGPAVPASVKTVPEFFAWTRANPSMANFGSPAAGSTPHFVGALLGRSEGVDFKHVAYRGSQPALVDMMGGNIASVSCPIGDALQHVNSGKMRLLGVSGAKRSRFVPDVPTYTEQGYKNMVHTEWFAFFAPAKTSQELVASLNANLRQALAAPEIVEGLGTFGLEAMSSTPAELTELLKKDLAKWAPIVKEIGFTADA